MSGKKLDAIDLMKLKSFGSANGWNEFLRECITELNLRKLANVRKRIQMGMDDLAKAKLNTDEMCAWFTRLNKSLEDTAKKIVQIKHPMPHDNPLQTEFGLDALEAKRKRDNDLAKFLKDSSY